MIFTFLNREKETGDVVAAKYLRQEKSKVRMEAAVLRRLIQSAFVVQLIALYESNLNSILVTEYLAGGDLVTRTASSEYCLTERKCQIFVRQVKEGISPHCLLALVLVFQQHITVTHFIFAQ